MTPTDMSEYGPNWPQIVAQIRARSKNACEWCGARHGHPHPRTGSIVVLTTAHVYDRRKLAQDLDNLAHLCQRCHLGHDRGQHVQRWRYGVEPSGPPQQRLP